MAFLPVDNSTSIPVEDTVGCGPAGFGGLTWNNAISRWIQSSEAPDLDLPDLLRFSMPFFIVVIVIEVIVDCFSGTKAYSLRQGWTDAAAGATTFFIIGMRLVANAQPTICGVFERKGVIILVFVVGIGLRGFTVFPYLIVHDSFGINKGHGFLTHVLAFLGVDLALYCAHRWSHASNLGWSAHNMHHSGPEYNLLVSFRQGPDQTLVHGFFYLPVAIVAPIQEFFLYYGILYTYQFFVHSSLIKKKFPAIIEYFMVTPSHHRVHHARNYPRANYGGVLIIWDRMFGTFLPELDDKPCIYGLDERQIPLGTHNPVWQQGHHFWYTFKGFAQSQGINRLKVLFTRKHVEGMIAPGTTDSKDDTVPLPPNGVPTDTRISWMDAYVGIQGALCFPVAFYTFFYAAYVPPLKTVVLCANLLFSFATILTLMDEKNPMVASKNEIIRLIVAAISGLWLLKRDYAVALTVGCMLSSLIVYRLGLSGKSHNE